jgi:hypothetical protein
MTWRSHGWSRTARAAAAFGSGSARQPAVSGAMPRSPTSGTWWRTADTQLRHSPLLLIYTLGGMLVAYQVPPLALIEGLVADDTWVIGLGGLATAAMAVAFLPTLRFYNLGGGWILMLPVAAMLFAAMTVDSAIRYRRGAGGLWKGPVLTQSVSATVRYRRDTV